MLSLLPAAALPEEFFSDDLLDFIDERRVIPIVGAELVTVPDGNGGEEDRRGHDLTLDKRD